MPLRNPIARSYPFAVILTCLYSHAMPAEDSLNFNRDIRPILADKCFACHGFDAETRAADLRLDTAQGALADRDGQPAIVPGDKAGSIVWERIHATDPSVVMPPPESHKELTEEEKALLGRWIEQGANYQSHWSFAAPVQAEVPAMPKAGRNPIDAFIAQRLSGEGWELAEEASKPILIRRVAFALTGLPPTLAELDEYLSDDSLTAYEKMVDRYLQSDHYGEEMARHWLDVARYADTHGLHLDNERQMWAYRDWVVRSFNRNQPFDSFTIDQLAGDLLPDPTQDQWIATGFNRCNVTTSEGGSIDDEYHYRYAVDRASTMASTWMALTAGCAVCHDHKFDPISAKEFYSLYAFFNASADPAMDGNALLTNPVMKLETTQDRQKLADYDRRIAEAAQAVDSLVATLPYHDPAMTNPAIAAATTENIWMEDAFSDQGTLHAGPGHPTRFVAKSDTDEVFSGEKSLKRTDVGLSQDVWDEAKSPLALPPNGILFAHVFLDPKDPPQAVMLQYFKNGWLHRAVWGNYDIIAWGTSNTNERVSMGPLPQAGQWVRLEIPLEKIGLAPGDLLTGYALTQFGGTVTWDKVGVSGMIDPANDPQHSFWAWWRSLQGKDKLGLPRDLNAITSAGPGSEVTSDNRSRLMHYYLERVCVDTQPAMREPLAVLDGLKAERKAYQDAIPSTFVYRDAAQPRPSFVMVRGQYNQPGEPVEPGVPAVLPSLTKKESVKPLTRLDLARWLVAPEHPLTARVAVNRYWQQLFGIGLVKTSADFGTQGDPPSHPELLDWLAIHFQESDWDVKQLLRTMLTSATFRQSSRVTRDILDRDPEDRLHARGPRMRLDAEQIRDNALFVSGLIDLTMGGKGVKPYQPKNVWEPVGFVGSNTRFYQQDNGSALYRRSLYTFYKRTAPPPFMVNFDAPNREQSCTRRERSNTPLQALQLLNDVQHVEAARALGERALAEGGSTNADRIQFLFRTVLSREPGTEELAILEAQYAQHLERYHASEADAKQLIEQGETPPKYKESAPEIAAVTLVASTVLNMDETLSRN